MAPGGMIAPARWMETGETVAEEGRLLRGETWRPPVAATAAAAACGEGPLCVADEAEVFFSGVDWADPPADPPPPRERDVSARSLALTARR